MLMVDCGCVMVFKDFLYYKFEVKGEYVIIKWQNIEVRGVFNIVEKLYVDVMLIMLFYCVIDRKVFMWVFNGLYLNVIEWFDNEEDYWGLMIFVEIVLIEIRKENVLLGVVEDRLLLVLEMDSFEDIFDIYGLKFFIQLEYVINVENFSGQFI